MSMFRKGLSLVAAACLALVSCGNIQKPPVITPSAAQSSGETIITAASVPTPRAVNLGTPAASNTIVFHTGQLIYTMDTDGTDITQITFDTGRAIDHVAMSPDKSHVVASYLVGSVYKLILFNLSNDTEVDLLPHFYNAGFGGVDWDQNGNIYFAGIEDLPYDPDTVVPEELIANAAAFEVYRVKYDGTNLKQMTNTTTRAEADVSVSRDGSRFAYRTTFLGQSPNDFTEIWIHTTDGVTSGRVLVVTDPATTVHDPVISPDNTKIAYSKVNPDFHNFPGTINTAHDLYTINVDGTEETRITTPGPVSIIPDWKDTQIVFLELDDDVVDYLGTVVINQDGSGYNRINGTSNIPKWLGTGAALPAPTPAPTVPFAVQDPSYSIHANPKADTAITTYAAYWADTTKYLEAAARVQAANVGHVQETITWSDIESSVGNYDWTEVDRLLTAAGSLPIQLNIAVINGASRAMPVDIAGQDFSSGAVLDAFNDMLTELEGHIGDKLWILTLGKEVDLYFVTYPTEIAAYGTFVSGAASHAYTLFGVDPFRISVNFSFDAVDNWSDYAAITAHTGVESFTYYNVDHASDFTEIITAIGPDTPFIFQEIGIPSHVDLGFSPSFQADVVNATFAALDYIAANGHLMAATWYELNEFNTAVLTDLGVTGDDLKRKQSLGLRDVNYNAKDGWYAIVVLFGGSTGDPDPVNPEDEDCTFVFDTAASDTFTASAGSDTVNLSTSLQFCAWTTEVEAGVTWLTVTPNSSTGDGTITYSVTANGDVTTREADFTVVFAGGSKTLVFTVVQQGSDPLPGSVPDVPTSPSPADSATNVSKTVTITATVGGVVTGCTIWIDDQPTVTVDDEINLGPNCIYTISEFAYGSTVYWKFRPSNGYGTQTGMAEISFTIESDPGVINPDPSCASTTASLLPGGYMPMGVTSCGMDAMIQAKNDYLSAGCSIDSSCANTPSTPGGKWFKTIRNRAANPSVYEDTGTFDADMAVATGDCTFVSRAKGVEQTLDSWLDAQEVLGFLPAPYDALRRTQGAGLNSRLSTLIYELDVMKPCIGATNGITQAQYDRAKVGIAEQLQGLAFGTGKTTTIPPGLLLSDSDAVVGLCFPIWSFYERHKDYQLAIDLVNGDGPDPVPTSLEGRIGGLTPTKTADEYAASPDTCRNAIQFYAQKLAANGAWIESSSYDPETVRFLAHGYLQIKTIKGTDYFPEVRTFLLDYAKKFMHTITPDLLHTAMEGDAGGVNELHGWVYTDLVMALSGALRGTTEAQQLHDFLTELADQKGYEGFGTASPTYLTHFHAYDATITPIEWRDSLGEHMGHLAVAKSDAIDPNSGYLWINFGGPRYFTGSKTVTVHHAEQDLAFGSWEFYQNGQWKSYFSHTYNRSGGMNGGDPANVTLMHGWAGFNDYQTSSQVQATTHAYITGTTGGGALTNFASAYCGLNNTPDGFAGEKSRDWVLLRGSNTLLVFDRMNSEAVIPERTCYNNSTMDGLARMDLFDGFHRHLLIQHTFDQPVNTGNRFDYNTKDGVDGRMTVLFPSAFNHSIIRNLTQTTYWPSGWAQHINTDNRWQVDPADPSGRHLAEYHIRISPTTNPDFQTYLTCHQWTNTPTACTGIEDAGRFQGAHVVQGVSASVDALVLFNSEASADLNPTKWHSSHDDDLNVARFRETGTSAPISWTPTVTKTRLIVNQLNPANTWTYSIDGGAAQPMTACVGSAVENCLSSNGHFTIELTTTVAAHTIAITGS